MFRTEDVHVHVAVWRAAVVVRAKHAAQESGITGGRGEISTAIECASTDIECRVAAGGIAITADVSVGSAAIDIALDGAAQYCDLRVAIHAACQIVGSP